MLNFVAIPKGIDTTPGTSELYRLPPANLAGYLEEIFPQKIGVENMHIAD